MGLRAQAETARQRALEKARIEADRKLYDIRIAAEKAAVVKAATPGPVGTIGGTTQLPGTVFTESDGSDAPNTAAAAGAVAATEALHIADGNRPGRSVG